ncbi:MAG TPA: malate synthase A, partial [Parachlamydiaceae bacterium]|nr:malate synthase A [Parachlamydiaceae bacterium]
MRQLLPHGIQLIYDKKAAPLGYAENHVITPEAMEFLAKLHRAFDSRRQELLNHRKERQIALDKGHLPSFLKETAHIRNDSSWKAAPAPADLEKRWVEITGPTDKKMMINALNSGADVFMADFEDSNSPTWHNMVEGQLNLSEAVAGTLAYTSPEGKDYHLNPTTAVLIVRPRGWHLEEKHLHIDGVPISASLFDFGLSFFHNAQKLIKNESGPYYYLPKLESHLEARLWNDVFIAAQKEMHIPQGTIRATVLIETILAAFEME